MTDYDNWKCHDPRDDEADPADDDREDPNPYPCDDCPDFNEESCNEGCPKAMAWEKAEGLTR